MKHLARVLGFASLVAALLAVASSDVAAQKKKKKANDASKYPVAGDADYKAIQKYKELTGKLVAMDASTVNLRVEYSHWEPNPKYRPPTAGKGNALANQQSQMLRTYNDIMRQQQQIAMSRNPRQVQTAMRRLNQDMNRLQQEIMRMQQQMYKMSVNTNPNNQPFIAVPKTMDFELTLEDKVVFRKMVLPFEYDDTGKPKTYSEKEKLDLRGDDKTKPGYIAKLEEFQAGQEVKLHLTAPKKKESSAKDADKDVDKDKDPKAPEEVLRPTVRMVVMTKDNPNASTVSGADDTKRKKKN